MFRTPQAFYGIKTKNSNFKDFLKKKNAKPLFPRIQNKLQEAANDAKPN
jgi:hypothetical protein